MPRGSWDTTERALAQQLNEVEPAWTVWYGVGSRRFFAIATWGTSTPLIVEGRSIDEVRVLMREVESESPPYAEHVPHVPAPTSQTHVLTTPTPHGASMTRTPDGLRTVTWDIPHDLAAVGKARHMANEVLTGWGLSDLADDVVLVIGELLSNAVSHGAPPIRLSLWATADDLCVRVTDHGPEAPRHLDLGPHAVHGRGLPIFAALAGARPYGHDGERPPRRRKRELPDQALVAPSPRSNLLAGTLAETQARRSIVLWSSFRSVRRRTG
ncbi:ATP-binding protein [Sphaerisporangium sp. NPDC051017]|uniref:ATP-binding protein n=1 Tax=Sphaerisporangium sp. NPDC051017 TaxID=3154636 RepID=UPI00342E30DC